MPSGELIKAIGRIWKSGIGRVLRKKRKQLGMTTAEMIRALPGRLRIGRKYLNDLERGRKIPDCELVKAIEVIWENNIGRVLRKKRGQLEINLEDMVSALRGKSKVDSGLIIDIEAGTKMPGDELIEAIYNLWRGNIGRFLRQKREGLGMTEEDMALEISDGIKITPNELYRIEQGKRMPSDEIIDAIVSYYENEMRLKARTWDDADLIDLGDEEEGDSRDVEGEDEDL